MESRLLWSRAALVAAVVGVSVLGDLRSQASEAPASRPAARTIVVAPSAARAAEHRFVAVDGMSGFGDDVDAGQTDGAAADDSDDGGLVPAIYAWDPDVRFVYYRHVSKWM